MVSPRARQYRPGRGRHVENTIMSALVRAGLVPRSYLLTSPHSDRAHVACCGPRRT